MHRPAIRSVVALAAVLVLAAQSAHAQNRRQRNRDPQEKLTTRAVERHPSGEILGLEFKNPLVQKAVELVEAGKGDEAVKLINDELGDRSAASPQRDAELNVGLGLVHLRLGDFPSAGPRFSKHLSPNDSTGLRARCKVLSKCCERASKKDIKREHLFEREYWKKEVVLAVKRDLYTDFKKHHDEVSKDIDDDTWTKIAGRADQALDLALWIDTICYHDDGPALDSVAEHARLLIAEVGRIETAAKQHHADAMSIKDQISNPGTKGKRQGKKKAKKNKQNNNQPDGERNSLIDENDDERNEITWARDAATALIKDYEKLQNVTPGRLTGSKPQFRVEVPPKISK